MSVFKRILRTILLSVMALFFSLCMIIFIAFNTGEYEALQINGDDMKPDLNNEDIVIIRHTNLGDINIGDIVTFQIGNNKITHKVIAKQDGVLSTQGTNLDNIDTLRVDNDNIRGKVITKLEGGGHFILFVTNPFNMVVVLCIILCLMVLPFIMKIKTQDEE